MNKSHWRTYWREVRALEPDRERLRRALIWGIFTVHTSVAQSERDFDTFMRTGGQIPSAWLVTRRTRAIADVNAFIAGLDFDRFARYPLARKLDLIVRNVYGLGYAKSAFALTCAGMADIACLDIWALRHRLGRETRAWRNADAYLVDAREAFGARRSGHAQWAFYARLQNGAGRAFRRTSHRTVFAWLGVPSASGQIQGTLWADIPEVVN